ncbi:MFS transporter [Synoicihabitans lomoniglobus]|uniref:MFS transporter n=1 Tax=Synoicihabitans lomoniglobus TaxID=2909285 RepID=A0AAE9ZVP0_9BACT|nr:MFS transporter [Opitutaceae bacterium LMO-M01]WED63944.1 MFS transporter [Opitutaceae bacterium LMO-M01]
MDTPPVPPPPVAPDVMPVQKREVFGWCCFDFANSAFTTIVITVVGLPYFTSVVAGGDPRAAGWWGTALSLSQILVIFMSPLIGVVADVRAHKKRFLLTTAVVCSVATAALLWVGPGQVFLMLAIVLVANVAFSLSENICSAFLPEISTAENVGRISGYGWAFGYFGGLLSLGIALAIVTSGEGRAAWTFLATGGFFFLASLPTLLLLKERARPRKLMAGETYWSTAWAQFSQMKRELPQLEKLVRFFIALTFYISGLMAVVAFSAGYATEVIGMAQNQVIGLFAVLQLAGVAGAFGFGWIQDRVGPKTPLVIALVLWVMACGWASVCSSVREFYAIGVLAGVGLGSLQSASRAVVATLTPPGRAGEFFGYWGFFGKLAGVVGPLVFGWTVAWLGYREAILFNAGFFLIGLALLAPLSLRSGKSVTIS